jgi:hypothetical protein
MKPQTHHDNEDVEVESEEKQNGEEIEVDEDRLPSRAMAIHEHIRQEGKKRWSAMPWRYCGQRLPPVCRWAPRCWRKGSSMSIWRNPGGFLLENLGYTFGFVIVILARQQLFTENTVTAVLPVMHKPTPGNIGLLMRLWGWCWQVT